MGMASRDGNGRSSSARRKTSGPVRVKSAPTGPFHSGAVLPCAWLLAGWHTDILYLIPYFFSPVHRYLVIHIFSEKKPPQLPLPIPAHYFSPLAMLRASSPRPASSSGITQHNTLGFSDSTWWCCRLRGGVVKVILWVLLAVLLVPTRLKKFFYCAIRQRSPPALAFPSS